MYILWNRNLGKKVQEKPSWHRKPSNTLWPRPGIKSRTTALTGKCFTQEPPTPPRWHHWWSIQQPALVETILTASSVWPSLIWAWMMQRTGNRSQDHNCKRLKPYPRTSYATQRCQWWSLQQPKLIETILTAWSVWPLVIRARIVRRMSAFWPADRGLKGLKNTANVVSCMCFSFTF